MSTVKDPGRLSKPVLISRVLRQIAASKLKAIFENKRDFDVLPKEWAAPDSGPAREAERLVAELCDPIILAHSYRTYFFGAILGLRDRLRFDRELFFIAALLHDLGLTEAYDTEPGSFEWVGAEKARVFCKAQGYTDEKADLVHDAIALHTSFGLATSREPEVSMVHYGAGVDILGRRVEDVPRASLDEILEKHPRDGCKAHFAERLYRQAELKPTSHIAGHVAIGLPDRLIDTL